MYDSYEDSEDSSDNEMSGVFCVSCRVEELGMKRKSKYDFCYHNTIISRIRNKVCNNLKNLDKKYKLDIPDNNVVRKVINFVERVLKYEYLCYECKFRQYPHENADVPRCSDKMFDYRIIYDEIREKFIEEMPIPKNYWSEQDWLGKHGLESYYNVYH